MSASGWRCWLQFLVPVDLGFLAPFTLKSSRYKVEIVKLSIKWLLLCRVSIKWHLIGTEIQTNKWNGPQTIPLEKKNSFFSHCIVQMEAKQTVIKKQVIVTIKNKVIWMLQHIWPLYMLIKWGRNDYFIHFAINEHDGRAEKHNWSWEVFGGQNYSFHGVCFVLFFKREGDSEWWGAPEGEGERILSRLHTQHGAQHGTPSHDPEIMTWAEIKSWMLPFLFFKVYLRGRERGRGTKRERASECMSRRRRRGRGRSRLPTEQGAPCWTQSWEPGILTWAKGRCWSRWVPQVPHNFWLYI